MKTVKQVLTFLQVLLVIFSFLAVAGFTGLLYRNKWKRTFARSVILKYWAAWACRAFNLRPNLIGFEEFKKHKNALLASNHLSYLDVIALASNFETCFVTSVEIRETPFLGRICMWAGCLFVERRTRSQLTKEIGELQEGLEHGLNVAIFPEATSTNGEQILRFRRPLFLSAVQAAVPVVPVCVNYRRIENATVTKSNRDEVCWYGDMPFLSHLWNLCGRDRIDVDLIFQPALSAKPGMEPGDLAASAQASVEAVFRPFQ